jgi:hypothetical protein
MRNGAQPYGLRVPPLREGGRSVVGLVQHPDERTLESGPTAPRWPGASSSSLGPVSTSPAARAERSLRGGRVVLAQDLFKPGDAFLQLELTLPQVQHTRLVAGRQEAAVGEQHELELGALVQLSQPSNLDVRCSNHTKTSRWEDDEAKQMDPLEPYRE